jgi:hypothetical protein
MPDEERGLLLGKNAPGGAERVDRVGEHRSRHRFGIRSALYWTVEAVGAAAG